MAAHLATALTALGVGAMVLSLPKGTAAHKALGRAWVALMAATAISSFWIQRIGEGGGFSAIHLLSAWTLVSLTAAVACIRRGNVRAHRGFMVGTLLGLAGAGLGALAPGRALNAMPFGG